MYISTLHLCDTYSTGGLPKGEGIHISTLIKQYQIFL